MIERKMDRPIETMFDVLTTEQRIACVINKDNPHEKGFLERAITGPFVTNLCEEQQFLTMNRVARWLRGNAKFFNDQWEIHLSQELNSLADELDYLSDLHNDLRS